MTAKKIRSEDLFANIAAQRTEYQKTALVVPEPPELPDRKVPSARSNPDAAFRPSAKLDTPEKLETELARARKRTEKFLRDLAPPTKSTRITVPIKECDWRLETDADRQDFPATLNGKGRWERVQLPHYGGPTGRAVAYYRTTFNVTKAMLAKGTLFACFKGVDYEAHVFVNGSYLGSHEGFFAPFEFEFTAAAKPGENVLLVKVENDAVPISDGGSWGMDVDGDKLYAATGLGWHHCPPGMGIYQDVTIEARPTLHLADVFVRPRCDEQRAEIWVEVFNCDTKDQPIELSVSIFGQNFPATVCRDMKVKPAQTAGPRASRFHVAVDIPKMRLWDLETPWLYQIQITLPNGDSVARQFGMRTFEMDTQRTPYGRFYLNGREIRLRGANTMGFEQQDVLRGDFDQLRDDILLAKLTHMNFLRLTQRPVQPEVYDMCDRLGLMTQTDLPLFGRLPRRQFCEAVRQAEEMERLVRNHPCNVMVSYINEPYPQSWNDKSHRHCTREELEQFFEAADHAVRLANPDRVIKPVDGDYDPPAPSLPDNHCYCCWYNGHGVDVGRLHKGYWMRIKPDWHYGCGEFGAEGLDPVDLMRKHYPKDWLPQSGDDEADWSPNRIANAQTGRFHYMFYDTPQTLADWVDASRRHQAWATRIMTEAFRRNDRMNTFAIHLFIDAFPAGWMKSIMDCRRAPKPAWFAYREALTPLMTNIRTDRMAYTSGENMRFEFWVCNDTQETPGGAQLRYQLEVGDEIVFAQKTRAHIRNCGSAFQGFLDLPAPAVATRTPAVLRLALVAGGKVLHDTSVTVELFPALPAVPDDPRVVVIGARNGSADRLVRDMGFSPRFAMSKQPNVILIDDMERYAKHREQIAAAVAGGATAVFLQLPKGKHKLAGETITIEECEMGQRHFVSRATGHPLVEGFEPNDFRLWYDPKNDYIAPLLATCFRSDGWTPILTTANGTWKGTWGPAMAVAEKRHKKGAYCICQIALTGRTDTNPTAARFARRLLEQAAGK